MDASPLTVEASLDTLATALFGAEAKVLRKSHLQDLGQDRQTVEFDLEGGSFIAILEAKRVFARLNGIEGSALPPPKLPGMPRTLEALIEFFSGNDVETLELTGQS